MQDNSQSPYEQPGTQVTQPSNIIPEQTFVEETLAAPQSQVYTTGVQQADQILRQVSHTAEEAGDAEYYQANKLRTQILGRSVGQVFAISLILVFLVLGVAAAGILTSSHNNTGKNGDGQKLLSSALAGGANSQHQSELDDSVLQINSDSVITGGRKLTATGNVLIQSTVDSADALKVQSAEGVNILVADTKNKTVTIGNKPPGNVSLNVNGDITTNGALVSTQGYSLSDQGLTIGGVVVCTARGCISSSSPEPTPQSPTIDVANLAFLNKSQVFVGNNSFSGTNSFNANATFNAQVQVSGNVNSNSGFSVNGSSGSNFSCPSGDLLKDAVVSGGIITGGTCVAVAGATTPTLQNIYDASSPANIVLSSGNGPLQVQDAASPLGSSLFAVTSNSGAVKYLSVSSSGVSIAGNVNATGQIQINGSQISSGNLSDSGNLAKLNTNQTFTGNNTFTNSGNSFTGDGSGLTNLNASNVASGTLSDTRLSSNVPLKNAGNTFSGANTFSNASNSFTGNGSGLSSLNASNISSGTLNDARLSSNVALLNGNQTFTGNDKFVLSTAGLAVQDAATPLGTDLFYVANNNGTTKYFEVSATALKFNGNDVCTAAGNCTGVSGGAIGGSGTAGKIAKFTGSGFTIGDSLITDNGSTVTIGGTLSVNTLTPTAALTVGASNQGLTIQGDGTTKLSATASGTTNSITFSAPSGVNKTITVPNASGTIAVSASGPLSLDAAGNLTCPSCLTNNGSGGGSGVSTVNSLSGNVTIAGTANQIGVSTLGSTITLSTPQDIANTSSPQFANVNVTGQFKVNGSQISSADLSNNSNLAKLSANQTFSGNNIFSLSTAGLAVQDAASPLGGDLFVVANNDGSTKYFEVSATALKFNGNNVCTAAGNCVGVSGGAIGGSGTAGKLAKFTGGGFTIGDSLISDNGSTVTVGGVLGVNTITPTATLTVGAATQTLTLQGDASTSLSAKSGSITNKLVFASPTIANKTITIPDASGTIAVSASGPLALDAAGNITCPSCLTTNGTGGGSGVSSVNSVSGAITLAGTANQITITPSGSTFTLSTPQDISTSSSPDFANVNVTGQFKINGSQISSSDLSNDANLAKLSASQTFTGNNLFKSATNSTGAFQIQDNAGTNNLFIADTQNTRIAIAKATASYTLDVGGDINTTGVYRINGSPISSGNLSDSSNLAKLNANQTFTGNNTFSSASNSFTGDGAGLTNVDAAKFNGQAASYYTNATNIASGTLNDARLSSNVALLNANNVFTNTNSIQATSSAEFQVQSASAGETLLTVDSSARGAGGGNLVKIGNSTGTDGNTTILVLDSATANPTSNLSALNGGLFYNSTTGKVEIIENGTVKTICNTSDLGCSSGSNATLASAYASGSSQTDSTIALDSTRSGVLIKDNTTPIGSTLFGVQNSTGSTKYFDVTTAGISVAGNINTTGQFQVNGSQISSANLSNNSNLAKLDAGQTFTGANNFSNSGNSFTGDGSGLASLNASNISSGTLGDSRLSSNVALLNANQTFTGNNKFTLNTAGLAVQDAASPLGADLFYVANNNGSTKYFEVSASALKFNGNDVCTAAGNCTGVSGGSIGGSGTAGKLAKFTGSGYTIGDSLISDNGSTVTIGGVLGVNTITPTATLTVGTPTQTLTLQGDASTSLSAKSGSITNQLVFATPTLTNKTITIPDATGTIAVSASGPLSLDAAGNLTCPSCLTSNGTGGGSGVSTVNSLSGAITLAGTANQITITPSGNTLTLSTPQNISTSSSPTFANINIGTNGYVSLAGGTTLNRPSSPTEGMLFYDTTTKNLLVYANGKWQADRSSSTKIVGMGTATGCSGSSPVASINADGADYVVTSCTSAQTTINSAITALGSTGGTVYLMEGTYIIDGSISVPSNVTLVGSGLSTVIKLKDSINGAFIAINETASSQTRLAIKNLKLDGNKANNSAGIQRGIDMTNSGSAGNPGVTISNVEVTNFRNEGIYFNGGGINSVVTNNTAISNGAAGIFMSLNANGNNVITGNVSQSNTTDGFMIGGGDNVIENNIAKSNGAAGFNLNSIACSRCSVTGNTADGNTTIGIDLGGTDSTVTSNVVENNTTRGINVRSNHNTVSNNSVYTNGTDGIFVASSATDNIVANNRLDNNTAGTANNSITIDQLADNTQVINNRMTDTAGTGCAIGFNGASFASNVYLSGNTYSGTGAASICNAPANTIYDNQLDASGNFIFRGQGGTALGSLTATASLSLQGGFTAAALSTPAQPSAVATGGTGTNWGYKITALDGLGETLPSAQRTISGFSTLDGTHFITLSWTSMGGAIQYKIYRTQAPGTPSSTGLIGTVSGNVQTFVDNGIAATTAAPTTNTTGGISVQGNALFKPTTDSATALQLQNAAATETLITIDTSARSASGGNLIKIGNSTGTDTATTVLVVDSNAGALTSNLSVLNGGLYYNSSTGHLNTVEGGAVKEICNKTDLGCGSSPTTTLQNAYDNSSSPATITTSSASKTVILKAGSSNDSTSLFQVQNSASASVFQVDTVNRYVGINNSAPNAALDINASSIGYTNGFESGTLSPFGSSFSGQGTTAVVNNGSPHAGSYNAYLGNWTALGGGQIDMTLTKTLSSSGTVSFWCKGNLLLGNGDSSSFLIDGVVQATNGCNTGTYTQFSYAVGSGSHTFDWRVVSGFFQSANMYVDDVQVTNAAGTPTAAIISGGNVGIGTTAPNSTLDIAGTFHLQAATNSASLFQIQNATAADTLLTVDSTARSASGGNLVKIGNSTGTDGNTTILQLDAATADPTSNLSALNGGLYYNLTSNKMSVIENGTVKVLCNTTDKACGSTTATDQTKVVAMGTATGCTGSSPVASADTNADYVVTSCTSAQTIINTAITAVASTGGTVYLKEGTYIVDGQITMASNVVLKGAGMNTILKLKDGVNAGINFLYGTGLTRIGIQDLKLDGNQANNTSGTQYGLYLDNVGSGSGATSVPGAKISNVNIENFRSDAMYFRGLLNSTITSSNVSKNLSHGITFDITQSSNVVVSENTVQGNGGNGIYANNADKLTFSNNSVQGNTGYGIRTGSNSYTISGNNISGSGNFGLYMVLSSDSTIAGNTITGGSATGVYLNSSDRIAVTGNNISGNSGNGIYLSGGTYHTVSGNNLYNNSGGSSIYSSASDTTISGNQAVSASNYNIYVLGDRNNINGNSVSAGGTTGIYIFGSDSSNVVNNEVKGNAGSGISVDSGSTNTIVNGNRIYDNGGTNGFHGINITGTSTANTLVTNNLITDTAGTGCAINLSSITPPKGTYLSNNTYSGTGATSICNITADTILSNQADSTGNIILTSQRGYGIGMTPTASLSLQGAATLVALPTVAQPTSVTPTLGSSTTWGYKVTALDGLGETAASTEKTTGAGAATLDGTHYNTITWTPVGGAINYKVYRTTAGGTPSSIGLIGTVTGNVTSFVDNGIAATTAAPSTNTSGGINVQGNSLFKPTTDSTAALQVQNASGVNLLNIDSTNSAITVSQGNFVVSGLGTPVAPVISAGSNQGGSLQGDSTTYYYKVTAINSAGGETLASPESSIAGSTFTKLSVPTALTAAANATAGNVTCNNTAGQGCKYEVTFVTANGETTGGTASTSVLNVTSKQIDLTNIPLGPTGTTSRKIYRSTNNGAYLLDQTIANNTATTATDNVLSPSGAIPGSNTATTNTNNATVTFTTIPGAVSYRIYRGTTAGAESAYQTTASSPFTDTGAAGTTATTPTSSTVEEVGIGTSSPTANLDVRGTVLFKNSINTSIAFQVQDSSGNSALNIDTVNRYVGINNALPNATLDVAASSQAFYDGFESNLLTPFTQASGTVVASQAAHTSTGAAGPHTGTYYAQFATGTSSMSITKTLSAPGTLTFWESAYDTGALGTATAKIDGVTCASLGVGFSQFTTYTQYTCAVSSGSHTITFNASSGVRMGIDDVTLTNSGAGTAALFNGGNVGIGTYYPSQTLDVSGTAHFQASTDSTSLFQIQNAAGSNALSIDSTALNSLLTNTNFENTTVSTWTYSGAAGGSVARDTTQAYLGSASLKITTGTSAAAFDGVKSTLGSTLSTSTTYSISWYDKITSGSFTDVIARFSYDGTTANASSCTGINTQTVSTSGWTRHSCQFTTGSAGTAPTSSNAIFIVQQGSNGSTQRNFFIDAVQVEASSASTAYKETALSFNGLINTPVSVQAGGNSTSAFNVQNSSGVSLFAIDSLNNQITLGSASSTPVLLVLGNKNTSGDPTCVNGAIYYNSNSNSFRGCTNGTWNDFTVGVSEPVGTIMAYAGSSAPSGYLLADGSAVSRTTYASLFALIGTTYGAGDGSTTFNLPDLRGRVAVGLNTSESGHTDVNALNNNEGLSVANRTPVHNSTVNDPGHSHTIYNFFGGGVTNSGALCGCNNAGGTTSTNSSFTGISVGPGGTRPTDTAAYLTVNYIIKF